MTPFAQSYRGFVYLIGSRQFGWYKIGKSKNPNVRIGDIGILLPFSIETIAVWKAEDHTKAEQVMHSTYSSFRINGEWFAFNMERAIEIACLEPPFRGIRIYPDGLPALSPRKKDVVKSKDSFVRGQQRKMFGRKVTEFLLANGLENNKENRMAGSLKIFEANPKLWEWITIGPAKMMASLRARDILEASIQNESVASGSEISEIEIHAVRAP